MRSSLTALAAFLAFGPSTACTEYEGGTPEPEPPLTGAALQAAKERLGGFLFEDTALSASGTLSCAGCHDADSAFTGSNDPDAPLLPVSRGAFPNLVGGRNAPTAMYLASAPPFSFVADEGELVPTGGLFWDGRVDTLAQQAEGPFLNPREMAMPSSAAVVNEIRKADYRDLFVQVFGAATLDDDEAAYHAIGRAIEAFEKTARFQPFTSKFDAVLRGKAKFSAEEARGFALFKDPEKGNCIGCHAGKASSSDPHDWLFTDFTYDNLGVPRNDAIADNADAAFHDLGLCAQRGLKSRLPAGIADADAFVEGLCGAFKVPTLRNVAITAPYMHNGVFAELADVVSFYVTRSTNPGRWYRKDGAGKPQLFDDLPGKDAPNVNVAEAPYDRHEGEAPRLDDDEVAALVAFLETLTDGY